MAEFDQSGEQIAPALPHADDHEAIVARVLIEIERLDRKLQVEEQTTALPPAKRFILLPSDHASAKAAVPYSDDETTASVFIPELGVVVTIGSKTVPDQHRPRSAATGKVSGAWKKLWHAIRSALSVYFPVTFGLHYWTTVPVTSNDVTALESVIEAFRRPEFRRMMCAGLRSTSGDLGDLYRALVRIMVPAGAISASAAALGQTTIRVVGVTFNLIGVAMAVLIAARAGVAAICSSVDNEDGDD